LKNYEHIRQNLKVTRHRLNLYQFPIPRKRAEKVFGKLLTVIPGVPPMLAGIRKEFMRGRDKARIEYELNEEEIDWRAVHKALEERLREIPDILPKELTKFQKMVEFQKTLPRKPKFDQPITDKLRFDVGVLYKGFVKLYNLTIDNLAMPWIKAADNFFMDAADNLEEFLRTGVAKEVPSKWINAVQTLHVFGEKVVLVLAGEFADPNEAAMLFQEEYAKTFKRNKSIFTKTDVAVADCIRMRLEGMAYKDIADVIIQGNRGDYPKDEHSVEFKVAKDKLEDRIKHDLRNALIRLKDDLGEEN
jgi:hypothetical protein